jgi:hypothetical protein
VKEVNDLAHLVPYIPGEVQQTYTNGGTITAETQQGVPAKV